MNRSDNLDVKKQIYETLVNTPGIVHSSNTQFQTKCFLCGDSRKNPNKKRLGIKVDLNNPDEPVLYQCFNCNARGVFDTSMLNQLGIYDKELTSGLNRLNKNVLKDDGTRVNKYKNHKEVKIVFPPLYKKENVLNKIKYVYTRMGTKFPIEDFDKLKLVFDLGDFLKVNDIRPTNDYINTLTNDYIGFVSVNNEFIIFRDITGRHNMRYVKYNIFDIWDNSNNFYTIKNGVDLLSEEDIHLSIAEGPFDIMSLYLNHFNRDIHNNICIAACNGSFRVPLKFYMKKGFVGSNIKIDCYQDNDTKLNFKNLRNELKPFIVESNNFNVYYNTMGKDFGVPKDKFIVDRVNLQG